MLYGKAAIQQATENVNARNRVATHGRRKAVTKGLTVQHRLAAVTDADM